MMKVERFLFQNRNFADVLDEDSKDGEPIVLYRRRKYVVKDDRDGHVYIQIGKRKLRCIGSIISIGYNAIKLYWDTIDEYEQCGNAAIQALRDEKDCKTIAFGIYKGVMFTEDEAGFCLIDKFIDQYRFGSMTELKEHIDRSQK
ncbi:hypothetical protein [Chitinophaga sp. CF418]|uniref:hypothetical protein n=1 Tax=Chitinophaga sp. CF418 TaxID=1855287 RepID=UPI00091347AD|nr:hypothetical protein [Chitinophaga sp. CF418]SHN45575.1 hypothetical protein SAMN05216311_120115 [Chitinophaga sp. CF418]